ncbi:MAG: glycosyltransferase [Candidatus Alcyoniella australis]|nr:glycosyltransferase [Candidatus Alcyoniella australis]
MLKGQNIICIASSNWEAMWVNSQHLMSRLARENRVFYINNMGLRAPSMAKKRDLKQVFKRLRSWFRGVRRVEDSLWVYDPISLPFYESPVARAFNRWALRTTLRRYQRRLGLQRPILWAFLPTAVSLVGGLDEKLVIYHCVDDYSANPGVPRERIIEMERRMLGQADMAFVTSPKLYRDKSVYNPHTELYGNVANVGHFIEDSKSADGPPDELAQISGPIIGYQGNISSYKTDLELLLHVARSRPQWSLVLVGPTGWGDPGTDTRLLQSLPNVHLLGRIDYERLPRYVAAFDVALIPFRVSESTQSSFPMKFFEYLALGKPVVSTALDALAEFGRDPDLCRIAANHEQFVEMIEHSLQDAGRQDLIEKRINVARDNDWERRVEQIGDSVQRRIEELGR